MTPRCEPRRHHWHRHRRGRRRVWPRRMFWRVYLYGLVLLGAVALALGGAARALYSGGSAWSSPARFARYADAELTPLLQQPAELSRKLELLHDIFDSDAAIYRASGERVASAGDAPGPLASTPAAASVRRRGAFHQIVLPLDAGSAYLVGQVQFDPIGSPRWLLLFAVVLLVLALVSLPLARTIVRPIERVTAAARALGEGDLGARTGIDRPDEVGELARAFDQMAERLRRLVESEKELLANVSHELRTPLARIRVALELAEEVDEEATSVGGSRQPLARHLEGMSADLRELEELLDNVLSTARLDLAAGREGAFAAERRPLAVDELLAAAAERFQSRHPGRTVELEVQPALPDVTGDPHLLRRVLDNLLDNAGKYADAAAGPVQLEATADDGVLSVSVRDRGVGVEPADLPRLFEPFFRADRSRERGTGGVGLGLTLCRRIVEAHGGTMAAELPEGGGLAVRFTLPAARG